MDVSGTALALSGAAFPLSRTGSPRPNDHGIGRGRGELREIDTRCGKGFGGGWWCFVRWAPGLRGATGSFVHFMCSFVHYGGSFVHFGESFVRSGKSLALQV